MKSRRAISPVIATVILIAVAVALGIAVAVWAGALTGSLQKSEKLVINAYENAGGQLVVSITNNSPTTSTITQVLFNSIPTATFPAFSLVTGTLVGSYGLASGSTGTFTWTATVAVLGYLPATGITYPISVVTAAGNTYPVTITWS